MQNVRGDHLLNDILLSALDCDNFRSHMCAVGNESKTPKFGHKSDRERFEHVCGASWIMRGGRDFPPPAAGLGLPFDRSDDEYLFCRALALVLEKDARYIGCEFFHLWRRICNVSELATDKVYARPSIPADF